VFLSAD